MFKVALMKKNMKRREAGRTVKVGVVVMKCAEDLEAEVDVLLSCVEDVSCTLAVDFRPALPSIQP